MIDFQRARRVAQKYVADGYLLFMAPFTMQHRADERLADTKRAFIDAQEFMHRGRPWRRFAEEYGVIRLFYGNEITDGENGWHFHRHPVYAVRAPAWVGNRRTRQAFAKQLERELFALHEHALARFGRSALPGIGVKVTLADGREDPDTAAAYATKFALESTSSVAKDGRRGHKTPWQLLDDCVDKRLSQAQRARARARFREFVEDTRGMHWTFFSDACRDIAGPNPDELEWERDPGVPVLTLSDWQWRCVRFLGKQLWLLELVEREGADVARGRLERLCDALRWSKRWRWRERWWEETAGGELMDAAAF